MQSAARGEASWEGGAFAEQEARSKEQGARSKEQGARSKEHSLPGTGASCPLQGALASFLLPCSLPVPELNRLTCSYLASGCSGK